MHKKCKCILFVDIANYMSQLIIWDCLSDDCLDQVSVNLTRKFLCWGFCSYALAIGFQKQVVDTWESHGPSARDELKEAERVLEQLKKKAHGDKSNELPTKALPLPQTSTLARR